MSWRRGGRREGENISDPRGVSSRARARANLGSALHPLPELLSQVNFSACNPFSYNNRDNNILIVPPRDARSSMFSIPSSRAHARHNRDLKPILVVQITEIIGKTEIIFLFCQSLQLFWQAEKVPMSSFWYVRIAIDVYKRFYYWLFQTPERQRTLKKLRSSAAPYPKDSSPWTSDQLCSHRGLRVRGKGHFGPLTPGTSPTKSLHQPCYNSQRCI